MSDGATDSERGLLFSAVLVAAVSAVLLTGFILKAGPETAAGPKPASALVAPPLALGSTVAPEPKTADAAPASTMMPTRQPEATVPAAAEPAQAPAAPAPEKTVVRTKPAAIEPAPSAAPLLVKLATRVDRDRSRLSQAGGRFTAQLMVACKPENVDRFLAASGSPANLFVLPASVKNEACFRVCYGSYATLQEASAAADLPKGLRGKEKIAAVEIAKVLP